jgi:hypothetical protein
MILKFVVDFVDGQAVFLDAKETSTLVSFCLRLLQIYSSHNIGKVTSQVPYDSVIALKYFSPMPSCNSLSHVFTHFCISAAWCTSSLLYWAYMLMF